MDLDWRSGEIGKRLILGLLLAAIGVVLGGLLVFLHLYLRQSPALAWVLILVGVLIAMIGLLALIGLTGIVLRLLRPGQEIPSWSRSAMDLLLPIAILIGRLLGRDKEEIQGSFLAVHNSLVLKSRRTRIPPERILVLLPHCLQVHDCPQRVTQEIRHCKECGRCVIGEMKKLQAEFGVQVVIATGGTLARRWILEKRPQAVIAVACERDLTSGIQDTHGILVLGVANDRPHGPCFDTTVDPQAIREAILFFLQGGEV